MEALPAASKSDSEWEFPREKLDGLAEIGHGQFGIVYIGYATGIIPGEKRTRVAVKTLSVDGEDDFEAEVKIMKVRDQEHEKIISHGLISLALVTEEVMIVCSVMLMYSSITLA